MSGTDGTAAQRESENKALIFLCALAPPLWYFLWHFAHTNLTLPQRAAQIRFFSAAFLVFSAAAYAVWRRPGRFSGRAVWLIIAVGVIFRLTLAPVRPVTTLDVHRYLWEARLVNSGVNPYRYAPDAPEVAQPDDKVWKRVGFKWVPAAYPPLAQYVFALSGRLPADPILSLKVVLAAFDIGTVLLLPSLLCRYRRPGAWALLYAWHPLIVGEVVARGHLDSIGIFFLVLAMRLLPLTSTSGRTLSGASLAASVLSKGYAIFTLPFFWLAAIPWRIPFALGAIGVAILAYLPFASAGTGLFRGVGIYALQWEGYSAVFSPLDAALAPISAAHSLIARGICAGLFGVWLVCLFARQRGQKHDMAPLDSSFLALAGFYLLSPVMYPWYLSWTIPFLCLRPRPAWLLFTGTVFAFYGQGYAPRGTEFWWLRAIEYGIPLAFAIALITLRRRGRHRVHGG